MVIMLILLSVTVFSEDLDIHISSGRLQFKGNTIRHTDYEDRVYVASNVTNDFSYYMTTSMDLIYVTIDCKYDGSRIKIRFHNAENFTKFEKKWLEESKSSRSNSELLRRIKLLEDILIKRGK